ncbi:site-specific integrase [Burkholderia pseudomallei]|uniref:site-specific integrase n=1 Tax=Burkholderia pseudomallei TaxID=28450 RepID=UPI002AB57AA8|nr:site-specific integrase [Burkholderia pseudomallei]MDY7779546.1 site-specific integrase [Burkholderia pseudomallei]MDY7812341.1 site-specific integrase [Burkholderia pseudomallei]
MRLASHLRLSRHGVYSFRLVLPASLRAALGQTEIKRSLGTKNPASARLLAYALSAKLLPIIDQARRLVAFDPDNIDAQAIRRLIVEGLRVEPNGAVFVDRLETTPGREAEELREFAAMIERTRSRTQQRMAGEPSAAQLAERDELAAAIGLAPRAPVDVPQKLDEAIAAWLSHLGALAGSTRKAYATALAGLARAVGGPDTMVHAISRGQCIRYAEGLLAPGADGKSLHPKTVRSQINASELFLKWAVGNGRHPGPNPLEGVARPSPTRSDEGGAEAFTLDELRLIFEPDRYNKAKRPHQFWAPLIALFTGARANEIAQLRLSDLEEADGLPCIRIDHDPRGDNPTRTKNADSVRTIPMHPELIRLGLLVYAKDVQSAGGTRLFPHLPMDSMGKREKYISRDFNEKHLLDVGVHQPRRKVFHSFRDTAETALHANGANPVQIDEWIGHKAEGMGASRYKVKFTPAQLAELVLPRLQYPGLDLSGLHYSTGRWNDWLAKNLRP